jgi:hypothetical protein
LLFATYAQANRKPSTIGAQLGSHILTSKMLNIYLYRTNN